MRRNKDGEVNYCRLFGRFSLLIFTVALLLHADTFSKFTTKPTLQSKQYRNAEDKLFASYLKSQWHVYKKLISPPLYEREKPKNIANTKPKPAPNAGPRVIVKAQKEVLPKRPRLPASILVRNEKDVNVTSTSQTHDLTVEFFGTKLGFDIPQQIRKARFYPTSQMGVVNYFDAASTSRYDTLLQAIQEVKEGMRLNDWGVYLLVGKIARKIYRYDDEVQLFIWFVFNKLGYNVKVGLSNGKIVTIFYSENLIHSSVYFRFGAKHFYLFSHDDFDKIDSIYSYEENYPHATKSFELSLQRLPLFEPDYKIREFHFNHLGEEYNLSCKYNNNLMKFFATYPQVKLQTFFKAPLDELTYATLVNSLRHYINGKRAAEAMNLVLHFVQKAFVYERDREQFGHQKAMFAQETLFYKASDSEDRAVLFAYLMKRLFDVSVTGVKYANHTATALDIPLDGKRITWGKRSYVVADPTYVNANIGEIIPHVEDQNPKKLIDVDLGK